MIDHAWKEFLSSDDVKYFAEKVKEDPGMIYNAMDLAWKKSVSVSDQNLLAHVKNQSRELIRLRATTKTEVTLNTKERLFLFGEERARFIAMLSTVSQVSDRDRSIFVNYYFSSKSTLKSMAEKHNLPVYRVGHILKRTMRYIRFSEDFTESLKKSVTKKDFSAYDNSTTTR